MLEGALRFMMYKWVIEDDVASASVELWGVGGLYKYWGEVTLFLGTKTLS